VNRTTPGMTLHDVSGPGAAPAIVFVHATRLTRSMWTPQVERLSDRFRVVALDLPGHGARASDRFTLDGAAEALAWTIDATAGGRAVVVGLSLGGYVAIHLAASSPDRVRGLVLAGTTAEPTGIRVAAYLALAQAMDSFDGPRLDALNRRYFRGRYPPAIADPIVRGRFWSSGGADALRCLAGHAFMPALAAFHGPSLLLNGSLDLPFRLGQPGFARVARDTRSVRIAGATHLSNLDRPGAFSAAVSRFADGLA